MPLSPGALGATAAAIAVPVVMALLKKVKGLQHVPDSHKPFAQLAKEYSRWEAWGAILYIIIAAAFSFAFWKGSSLLSVAQMSYLEPSHYLIAMPAGVFLLPALFLAIFLSVIPIHFLYLGLLGKTRYAEYIEYGNQKHGLNAWKILRYMAYVIVPICLVFTFLSLDAYARVTDTAFVNNRFFSVGEIEYPYNEIDRIELTKSFKAPNGNVIRKYYHSLYFTDGTKYSFRNSLNGLDFDEQTEIVNFISSKADIEIGVDDPYPL